MLLRRAFEHIRASLAAIVGESGARNMLIWRRASYRPAAPIGGKLAARDFDHWDHQHFCEGKLTVAYAVTPQGQVCGLRILRPSGSDFLDRHTCFALSDRPFDPARDACGNAVAQLTQQEVRWRLRDGKPYPSAGRTSRKFVTEVPTPLGLAEPDWSSFNNYNRLSLEWANWQEAENAGAAVVANGPVAALIDLSFRKGVSNFARARGLEGLKSWLDSAELESPGVKGRSEARLADHIRRNPDLAWLHEVWSGARGHHSAAPD